MKRFKESGIIVAIEFVFWNLFVLIASTLGHEIGVISWIIMDVQMAFTVVVYTAVTNIYDWYKDRSTGWVRVKECKVETIGEI